MDEPEDPTCEVCGRLNSDHDFGELIAHLYGVPLSEARQIQGRIVDRLGRSFATAVEAATEAYVKVRQLQRP